VGQCKFLHKARLLILINKVQDRNKECGHNKAIKCHHLKDKISHHLLVQHSHQLVKLNLKRLWDEIEQ
jgi:hypothetical protein